MAVWAFREHRPDEKIRNSIQSEFFSEEAVERPAQALVREAIQNSLDARRGTGPVHVRFAVSGPQGLDAKAARRWLEGAWPHLRAPESGLRAVPEAPGTCRLLVVEDFGTSGLEGDPHELVPEGRPSQLFAFFRGEGLSQKGGKDAGRWGVGKTVFLRSSELNTILCLSIRASDGSRLLFGQSVLRYHWLNARFFTPDGSFGDRHDAGPIVPTRDRDLLERFVTETGLSRRDEPGLSVVVPMAAEELTGAAILESVTREYFYPILRGQLVVTVEDPALPGGPRQLTSETLLEELVKARGDFRDSVQPLAALTLWLLREGVESAVPLEPPKAGAPEWSVDMLSAPDRSQDLAPRFRRGEELLFRVPLVVHPVGEPPRDTFFHVLLKRDVQDRGAAPAFVRNGIQIPKALERRVRGQSLWALVLVEDQPIATLLGDAETPAHTHWSKDTRNFRNKYRYGAATIDFVRSAPRFLAETLTEAARGRDVVSLAEFFPQPAAGPAPATSRGLRADADAVPRTARPEVAPAPELFRLERLPGGFRVASAGGARGRLKPFRVDVAYDCTRGHPLRRFSPRDFDLAELERRAFGLKVLRCSGHQLVAAPEGPRFRLEVQGFDPNRDLWLRVTPAEGA